MNKYKFVIHFIGQLIITFLHIFSGIIVARIAGPEVLGIVNYATSYVAMFTIMLGFFGSSHLKFVSEGRDLGDCVSTFAVLQGSMIVLFSVLFLGNFAINKHLIGYNYGGHEQEIVILIAFINIVLHYVLRIISVTFAAQTHMVKQSLPGIVESVIYSLSRILVVLLGLGAIWLALSSVWSVVLIIPIYALLFKSYPIGKFNKKLATSYLGASLYLFLIQASRIFTDNFGKVFLKHFNSTTEVGIYTGGYSLAGMLLMISSTSSTIFFPMFSKLVSENKLSVIAKQIHRYQRFLFVFISPFVVLLSVYSKHIIEFVLGPKYMKSVDITSLLVLSSFVAIIGLPYANLVTGSGKLKQATTIAMISVVFYTGLLYTFISDWGLDLGGLGLAYTVFILQVFNAVAYHLYSRVHFHYDNDFENVKYVLLGSAMYLLLSVAYRLTSAGIFQLVVIPIFFVALFYGIASNMKLFGKADINELIQLVNAKGIHSYTKKELQNDSK